jgi:site-specific recombinase XerD
MLPITAANAWLRKVSQDGATSSFHTRRSYAYHLFDFFSYLAVHGTDWRQVDNETLIRYRDIQDQNASPHTKSSLKRRTINARLLTAGRFYSFAFEKGFIDRNPIAYKTVKFRRPADTDMLAHTGHEQSYEVPFATFERLSKPEIKWRPHEEVSEWLNSINVWRDKLIAKLLYYTGMRRAEGAGLKLWELPKRSEINASHLEVSFTITGKGGRKRMIYLPTRYFIELHNYIAVERVRLLRRTRTSHSFIFVNHDGMPLSPSALNFIFRRISKGCGIEITPHMLRHSFAVVALRCWRAIGVKNPEKLLQGRLGHASITTTQIYTHITDELKAEEAYANASLIDLFLKGEIDEE